MALSQSALSELLEAFRAGDGVDLIRESVRMVMQELIEAEATERIGAAPLRAHRGPGRPSATAHRPRLLATQAGDVRAADPQAAQGLVLPGHPRAPPPDRPGAVRGGDGGLRPRRLDPQRRRPGRGAWASTRGSPSPRSPGSAPASTRSSARSAPARWTTPSSPTSTSTPPTSTSATPASPGGVDGGRGRHRDRRRRRRGRSSASTSATARTRCSGAAS